MSLLRRLRHNLSIFQVFHRFRHSGARLVARIERSEIRGRCCQRKRLPGFAALNPGYDLCARIFVLASHNGLLALLLSPSRQAPLWRLLAPAPPWRNLRAVHMSGARSFRIGAFARPARSGGRAVLPGASRVLLARQRAGRRSRPAHAMPRDEHPWRTGRQDDNPGRARVKDFRRYAP
jgi:hypothetical protein